MPLRKPVLASLLMGAVVGPLVALETAKAQTVSQPGYSRTTECFRDEYREEYVPGTKDSPGYVRNWTEKVKIACADKPIQAPRREPQAADVDNKINRLALLHIQPCDLPVHRGREDRLGEQVFGLLHGGLGGRDSVLGRLQRGSRDLELGKGPEAAALRFARALVLELVAIQLPNGWFPHGPGYRVR